MKDYVICDKCLWRATCLKVLCRQEIKENSKFCPVCNQDQLSGFPLKARFHKYHCYIKFNLESGTQYS